MELQRLEEAKRDLLWAQMRQNELTEYEYDGKIVVLERQEKVKVRSNGKGETDE